MCSPLPLLNGRYTLGERLQYRDGQGTYRAYDHQTESDVVIKILNLEQLQNWEALDYFEREVNMLASLDHPAIPRLLDHFRSESPAACYLVQEHLQATSLRQHFDASPLTEAEALELAHQVLRILDYLQSLNPPVIHRDIKPDNLLQDNAGKIYLIDFGAVRDAARQHHLSVAGTFGYMAPEQAAGQVQPASDLYALAVTLIEGLSGLPPQELEQDQDLRLRFQDKIDVSQRFYNWLSKMADPVVEQRPKNAAEALYLLEAEAPSETVGHLQVQFPTAEETQIQILPKREGLSPLQLVIQSLSNQSIKFLVLWLGQFVLVTSFYNLLMSNPVAYMHWMNHLEQLISFGLLGGLVYIEWQALTAQDREPQHILLKGSHLYAQGQSYALGQLKEIRFGSPLDLKGPERTKIYFKFDQKKALRIPAALTMPERQLLIYTLEKHGQKHLNALELHRLQQAPNLG